MRAAGSEGVCVQGCAVLCQPALGGSRLPSGHSDSEKGGKYVVLFVGLGFLERGKARACSLRLFRIPCFALRPAGAAGEWQPLAFCAGCGIDRVRVHRHGAVSFELG